VYFFLCFAAFLASILYLDWNASTSTLPFFDQDAGMEIVLESQEKRISQFGSLTGISNFIDPVYGTSPVTEFVHFDGEASDNWTGFSAKMMDFNDDGDEDLIIGAISEGTVGAEVGAIYMFYGDGSAWISMSVADADVKITGASDTSGVAYTGKEIINAGDVDGDGADDLLFGAERGEGNSILDNGLTFLVYGGQALSGTYSADNIGTTIAGATFYGTSAQEQSGSRLSAGDFDNDGYNDLLVSAILESTTLSQRGAAYLIYGDAVRLSGVNALANVGGTIAGVTFRGAAAGDRLGKGVRMIDVDGDGYDDILASSTLAHYGGTADVGVTYLIYGNQALVSPVDVSNVGGSVTGASFYGEVVNDSSGNDIMGGFYNEDAFGDFSIFANLADNGAIANTGASYLIFGSATRFTGANALSGVGSTISGLKFIGEGESDRFGNYFTAADINNDGLNEYIVTATSNDNGGAITDSYGAMYVVYRNQVLTSPILASTIGTSVNGVKFVGEELGGLLGFDVTRVGDLNGDEYEEVMVGAYKVDVGAYTDAGKVYLAYFYVDADLDSYPGTAGVFDGTDKDDADPLVLDSWHPTVAAVSGVEATNGTNLVTVQFTLDDADDDDTCSAKVEYSIDGGSTWAKATLSEVGADTTATYGDPTVENDGTYQIGIVDAYITTSTGANTVTTIWNAGTDAPNTEVSNAQLRITPYDNTMPGTAVASSNFIIDTKSPAGLATLTRGAVAWNSLTPAWDVATDLNFDHYELWYGQTQSDVDGRTGTALEWDGDNDANLSTATTGVSLISGLSPLTHYFVALVALDTFGHESSVSSVDMPTIKKSESLVTASPGGSAVISGTIESFLITQARFPESSTIQEETLTHFSWTSTGEVPFMNLYYSLDEGETYTKIVGPTLATGSYDWTTPKALDATAILFKLEATDLATILDMETTKKALGVMRPIVGESPITGKPQQITEVFPGETIRSESFSGIYLVTDAYERRVFLNEETYFTWADSLDRLKVVSDATLASLPLVGRVLPKPGVVLVKVPFAPEVYAIVENSDDPFRPLFRWISSEQAAKDLFGSDWAQYVMDIPFDGFRLFGVGDPITGVIDYTADMTQMKKRTTLHE